MRRKKRGKKPSSNARARLSQSWWRHHFVVHPKHLDSLLPLFPRRESPKRKRKNGIGILRVGTPPPQRSATTTASFSSSDDHSPRNRFRAPRSRSHRPPPVANLSKAPDFFFFRSRHHERKRPNTTHLRAANRWPRRCANVGNPRAASVRVVFVFRSAKKRTIFLFFVFFFFCCCCYFVAMGLERVLCGAPNAYSF